MHKRASEDGYVLVYMTVGLTGLLLFSGLAVDAGRTYLVKAQLTKAVDGAALGAARSLNSGDPKADAVRLFKANFPVGLLGTSSVTDPSSDPNFYSSHVDPGTGINTITVKASAVLPSTFMSLANVTDVNVSSSAKATRRMVDLSLVLDVSSSIGSRWPAVRDAARTFINSFDKDNDRFALITFSNGARVLDAMPSGRGFDKTKVKNDVPSSLPGGSTNMVEGLYRGWDEIRSVPAGSQSGLRVIVLFTDGASNGVPGTYDASGLSKTLRTYDFPKNMPDPDNQTWNNPMITGLYESQAGTQNPSYGITVSHWNLTTTLAGVPFLPATSWHAYHRSSGIPTSFPLETTALNVNGATQKSRRGLRNWDSVQMRYPADVHNINNAARNLVEIIANAARSDAGDYQIRIYTIGMGELVRYNLGTMPEKPEDILKRIANDKTSPDFNSGQLEGKYFFAQTEADVAPAFQGIQNQILRLSQ